MRNNCVWPVCAKVVYCASGMYHNQCSGCVQAVDLNNDGRLDLEEFLHLMHEHECATEDDAPDQPAGIVASVKRAARTACTLVRGAR